MNIFLVFFTSKFQRDFIPQLLDAKTSVIMHKNKNSLLNLQPLQYKSFSRNYEEDYIVYTPSTSNKENNTDLFNISLKTI
jgi:Tfp pilus assembly protein FimT